MAPSYHVYHDHGYAIKKPGSYQKKHTISYMQIAMASSNVNQMQQAAPEEHHKATQRRNSDLGSDPGYDSMPSEENEILELTIHINYDAVDGTGLEVSSLYVSRYMSVCSKNL